MNALDLLLAVVTTLLGAGGALAMKRGAARFRLTLRGTVLNAWLVAGGTLYLGGAATYAVLLTRLPMSVAYPLTSLQYVWIALSSRWLFRERVDAWRWAGIVLIMGGTTLLSIG